MRVGPLARRCPDICWGLVDLGLVAPARGVFALTPSGSFKLAAGPAVS
jgi:hypothetical protein